MEICQRIDPDTIEAAPGHLVACHLIPNKQTAGATGGTEAEHKQTENQQGEVA